MKIRRKKSTKFFTNKSRDRKEFRLCSMSSCSIKNFTPAMKYDYFEDDFFFSFFFKGRPTFPRCPGRFPPPKGLTSYNCLYASVRQGKPVGMLVFQ